MEPLRPPFWQDIDPNQEMPSEARALPAGVRDRSGREPRVRSMHDLQEIQALSLARGWAVPVFGTNNDRYCLPAHFAAQ